MCARRGMLPRAVAPLVSAVLLLLLLPFPSPPPVAAAVSGGARRLASAPWPPMALDRACDLVYVKVHKCASSTGAGIARRVADRNGLSGAYAVDYDELAARERARPSQRCSVLANHAPAAERRRQALRRWVGRSRTCRVNAAPLGTPPAVLFSVPGFFRRWHGDG